MKEIVQQLINNKIRRYVDDYNEMLGDYYREQETVNGYNGRQILELLQNCDDEGAKNVLIKLNEEEGIISICNDGKPFSEKGYRSLFIANLSSKTSKRLYIGNKGLGFRSIINWSNKLEIRSNLLTLKYSEENIQIAYQKKFPEDLRLKIAKEEGLEPNVIPMPFLSIPILEEIEADAFVTSIIIRYKENFYDDILKQIDNVFPETLLFLRNIERISFEGVENKEDIVCIREEINQDKKEDTFLPTSTISFNNDIWYIFQEEAHLPVELLDKKRSEEEFYQIKIAVSKNFTRTVPYLFSFFPTNIKLNQPYILHATFDLDSTRNQLNNSEKNKYLLKKIIHLTLSVAKYYSSGIANYRPLQILNHIHKADTLDALGYYTMLAEVIQEEDIFPCVDNSYKKLNEVLYVDDDFANMLIEIGANYILDVHLLPFEDTYLPNFTSFDINRSLSKVNHIHDLLNSISSKSLTIAQRATYIKQLVLNGVFLKNETYHHLNLLINSSGEIIQGQEYTYTPIGKMKLKIPEYANIQFLNRDLYYKLSEEFNYNASDKLSRSRFVVDKLKGYCNIFGYEPTSLALKIISETQSKIKEFPENFHDFIKQMNKALFHNYLVEERDNRQNITVKVPVITLNKELKNTEDVFLSQYYPTGVKTAFIFKDIYTDSDYITVPEELGIEGNQDLYQIEEYLKWLNVNSFAKYKSDIKKDTDKYFDYIRIEKNIINSTGKNISYTSIINFEQILSKLTLEKLIIWAYFDEKLKRQLADHLNEDEVRNFYFSSSTILSKSSFIKFFINTTFGINFKDYYIDDRYLWLNKIQIDYTSKDFDSYKITKTEINEILILLGAKDNFNQLSIEKVTEILTKLPEQFPDGKKSLTFYKKALAHYRNNKKEIRGKLKLFADNGTILKAYQQNQVYFSDKVKLPKRLKQDFPTFNFPLRSGGAEAIKFFKIQDLKNLDITIQSFTEVVSISQDFNTYFASLKPFILTQRLHIIDDLKQRRLQATICNNTTFVFCSKIAYTVKELEYEVAEYEFLSDSDNKYLIRIGEFDTVDSLRKNFAFIESFADILSYAFDVSSEKNDYKHIIRDDLKYVELNIINDYGVDTLYDAKDLLGLTDHKQAFWEAIFTIKGHQYTNLDDVSLAKIVNDTFNINNFPNDLDYENLSDKHQLKNIRILFDSLNISLKDFNKSYTYSLSLYEIHKKRIQSILFSSKKIIKGALWNSYLTADIEIQANFLTHLNKFENIEEFAHKKSEDNKFEFEISNDNLLQEYISEIYPHLMLCDTTEYELVKENNLKEFDKQEKILISESIRFGSLIYFPSAIDNLKKELIVITSLKSINSEEREVNVTTNDENHKLPIISESSALKAKLPSKFNTRIKSVYFPNTQDSRYLKQKGNTSERIVYNYMKNHADFLNVYLVSEDNEGLHYDIRYTTKEGDIKYVEVKTFDYDHFFLSIDEYKFGKQNVEDYEIWLVRNKTTLFPIKDFYINSKYKLVENEYVIFLNI